MAAAANAGFRCSETGLRNMCEKTLITSVGPRRGVAPLRRVRIMADLQRWHPRKLFSSTLLKCKNELLTLTKNKHKARVTRLAMDCARKVQTYLLAESKLRSKSDVLAERRKQMLLSIKATTISWQEAAC